MGDTNWFYSTLAQSMAAIAGILGGFLFTAVLRQREEATNRKLRLITAANDLRARQPTLVSARRAFVRWFDANRGSLRSRPIGTPVDPLQVIALNGNEFGLRWEVQQGDVSTLHALRNQSQELLERYGPDRLQDLLAASTTTRKQNLDQLRAWRESNNNLVTRWGPRTDGLAGILSNSDKDIGDFADYLNIYYLTLEAAETSLNGNFIFSSLRLLGFLLIASVLFPLSLLSSPSEGMKGLMLFLAGIVIGRLFLSIVDRVDANNELIRIKVEDLDRPI